MLVPLPVALIGLIVFGLSATALSAQSPAVGIGYSDKGLASLKVGGGEFLAGGLPSVSRVSGPDGNPIGFKLTGSTFDAGTKKLTMTYDWGKLTSVYELLPDGLRVRVTLENTSQQILTSITMDLLALKSLGEGRVQPPIFCVGEPAFNFFMGSAGSAIFGVEDPKFPLSLDFHIDKPSGQAIPRAGFGGGRVVVDGVQMDQVLEPGQKVDFSFILRVGPAGTDPIVLADDLIGAFRKANPPILNWQDRRPIFRAFFGGGLPKDEAVANLKNPDAVVPPPPDEKFHAMLMKKIDGLIESAHTGDAQGLVIWDLEGETFPHPTTYIGDPRLVRLLNPQMDLFADEAMKKLRDAGLRVGVTVRPTRVVYDAGKNSARHLHSGLEPLTELEAKIDYAKQRWGCTIFYVDTNYFWRPYGPEKQFQSGRLTSDLWRQLRTKYPDILFIPEFASTGDYASVAGYGEADMGDYGMPAIAKALYPDAFRVIVIEDADPSEKFDRFVDTLTNRNCLMTFGQGATNPNSVMIRRMQESIALEKTPAPAAIASATAADLVKLLSSSEASVRFHAARGLAAEPSDSAGAKLLEIVQSEGEAWPVRREALVALGKLPYPPAIPVLFDLLTEKSSGLYADAAQALAGQNASVDELATEKIRAIAMRKSGPNPFDQIGKVLVIRKATGCAPVLQEIFSRTPESELSNRKALITLIGELRNPGSEAFLLPLLADPNYSPIAAAALVRIGSAVGAAQAKALADEAKKSGNKDLADALEGALHAK
jgi:HEAT repeat protein